jgi:hypothetical protein
MPLSFSDDAKHSNDTPIPPVCAHTDTSLDTSSGLSSLARTIVDDYLQKGGTLKQLEGLLVEHQWLAQEAARAHQMGQRKESASLARNFWRVTGISAYMAQAVLALIQQRQKEDDHPRPEQE